MATHTSRTMVGRDQELAQLVELVGIGADDRRWQGRPGAVLLSGDAGVGKTRLLIELRDRARAEGWRVLAGHCLDFGESALPYLPFSEVLDRFDADLPDVVEKVAAAHPALARLRPGRRVLAGADSGEGPSTDRSELFAAVHTLLEAAAEDAPLLLVVEDAHWADQSTRDLLGFLFTRSFARPVSIVASYRSDDLHRRHPLRRQVAEWSRIPSVDRLALSPLPEDAVRALIRELAPRRLAERDLADIVDRAEGNAFFVEELVASGGGWVPDDLADLLLVRLDRLSEEARQVVRIVSVAGRKVTHELLAAVSGMSGADLDAGVRQAVEMNVLVAGSRHYSFRHALLGEAVYDDLLPGERVRLHQQYVDALTSRSARGTAAELARHARRAMDLDRAAVASIQAGDEATSVGGPDEAARHYERALELLTDPERLARLDVDLGKLVVKAADAIADCGDAQRAAQLLAEHLDRLPADAPTTWRPTMLAFYADLLGYIESDLDPVDVSREAVELVPHDESALRVRVLATHARVLAGAKRTAEAQAVAAEALELAERLDLPRLVSEIVTTLGGLRTGAPESDLRGALEEAVRRAEDTGATGAELRGRWLLARSYQDAAEWDDAERWFRSLMDKGSRSGRTWAPYVLDARWQLGSVLYTLGRWDEALDLLSVVDDTAPVIPRAVIEPYRLAILDARGHDVLDQLRELRKVWPDEGAVAVQSSGFEIEIVGRTDPEAALAVYDDAVTVLSRIWTPYFAARVRMAAQVLSAVARGLAATPAARRGALVERADQLLADGQAVLDRYAGEPGQWQVEGRAWAARLRAEHLRVRWLAGVDQPDRGQLVEAWDAAVAGYEQLRHVPELARVRTAYSSILRTLGDTTAAREHGDLARETAHRLGATVLLEDLRAVGSAPARSDEPAHQRLTARELEILALVADGRSNGEIGRQLFISTKTVSVHVSNILAKLGAGGRTEAAAIGRREGLIR